LVQYPRPAVGPVGEEGRADERRVSARLVAHLHLPAGWRPAEV